MLLKFNNIRDLADARYAAAMMAEWIGFQVGGDEDLSATAIQEIIGWCAGPSVILEVLPGTSSERITGLLDVLPIDGLEAGQGDFEKLRAVFSERNLKWILKSDDDAGVGYYHTNSLVSEKNAICHVYPGLTSVQDIKDTEPSAISLDCFPSQSAGIKDFTVWNDFFDELELL